MSAPRKHNVRNVIILVVSIVLLLVLILFGSQNFKQKATKSKHTAPLNMAIVNEDNGTTYRNKHYLLAKDYLNGLNVPKDVSMVVVPRGVAESGLKNNTYQLVVYIPTNFSAKIVDVNNPDPKKLNIQYKINAKSQAMKSRCKDEAQDIIRGLNQKLVSIYNLGIMSNLFDAQNQVAGIYSRQGQLAAAYRNGLASPISTLSEGFPDLQSGTNAIISEGKAYQEGIKQANQATALAQAQQNQSLNTTLAQVMQEQAQNNQNNAKLVQQMMEVSQQTTNEEIPQILNTLSERNQQLSQSVGNSKDASEQLINGFEAYSKGYEEKIAALKQVLESTEGQIKPDEIKPGDSSNASSDSSSASSSSQSSSNSEITFGEYLKQNDPELYQKIMKQLNDVSDLNELYAQLPFNGTIPDEVKKGLSNADYQKIKQSISEINSANRILENNGLTVNFDGNSTEADQFKAAVAEAKKDQDQGSQSDEVQTQQITLSNLNNVEGDKFTIEVPKNVTVVGATQVANQTYEVTGGNSTLDLKLQFKPSDLKGENTQIKVTYNHKEAEPKKVTVTNQTTQQVTQTVQAAPTESSKTNEDSQTSQAQSSSEQKSTASQPAATTSSKTDTKTETEEISNDKDRSFTITFDLAGVSESAIPGDAKVAKITGEWAARYEDAAQMANARVKLIKAGGIQDLMNRKLSDVLSDLVNQANDQNNKDNQSLLAILNENEEQLKQQKAEYEKKLQEIGSNSADTLDNVDQQLQSLKQAQDQLKQAAEKMPSDSQNESATSASDDSTSALSDLRNDASETNASANEDDTAFDSIYTQLSELNKSLGSVQNSGKSLNGKSMNLQKAFQNELAKSGDFAQAFINVLNAAYKNGVPNQKLLNFITNPVGEKANEVISEHTQSYNMGLWTLVLAILSWFIAYAVETMKYFQSDKYFSKAKTKLNEHARRLIFLVISSLVTGWGLAKISVKQFPIIDANRLLWYLSFIFLSICMTLMFYVIIHQGKVFGTSLIVAAILNFMLNQTQFLKNVVLQKLNVLALVGKQLLNVAMFSSSNAILGLVVMGVVIIASGLMILFLPDRKQEQMNEQAMV